MTVQGAAGATVIPVQATLNPCSNPANFTPVNINISTATTTKILAHTTGKSAYVCHFNVLANGTNTVTVKYGTKTTNECDTSTGYLVGAASNVGWNFSNNNGEGIVLGNSSAPIWIIPTSDDWCLDTSGAVQLSGSAQVVLQ
jgi:hypothetical protein